MIGLNSVSIVGRAGQDPDVKYFESGSVIATFTLAVRRTQTETDWFNLELWGKNAEIAAQYVKKGSLIGVNGSLKFEHWTDKNTGNARSKPVIRCDRLNLLGSKADNQQQQVQEQF